LPPPPAIRRVGDATYATQLLAVVANGRRAALHRRREVVGRPPAEEVVIALDRVSADERAAEAAALGYIAEPPRQIPETERYLGATVAMLRA
jgi:hypothetical protein